MTMTPSDLLVENLPEIERIVRRLCVGRRTVDLDPEDFRDLVVLRLIENDYAVLRGYRGESSFASYVSVVAARTLLDYRDRAWGKWHSSAVAKRLGPAALELERRLYRANESIGEAVAAVRARFPDLQDDDLEAMMNALPQRSPRRREVSIDHAAHVALHPDVNGVDRAETAARLSDTIRTFIDGLPEDEQLLFRLQFVAGLRISQIADILHRKPFQLYQLIKRRLRALRSALEDAGIRAGDAEEFIGTNAAILDFLDADDQNGTKKSPMPEKHLVEQS